MKNIGKLINDILSRKINDKYDAEDEYDKKIKKNKDYLDGLSLKSEDSAKLREIFKDIEYAIFGIFLPSKES